MKPDGLERFWPRVDRGGPTPQYAPLLDGCWIWTGAKCPDGYGRLDPPGSQTGGGPRRLVPSHRFFYEHVVGPVPDGLVLDHLCRVRLCVNPDHLEPVTIQENTLRGSGLTAQNAKKAHCVKGHPLSGDNLKMEGNSRRCLTCRREAACIRYRGEYHAVLLTEDGDK